MSFRVDPPAVYLITEGRATDLNFEDSRRQILDIVRIALEENISLIQIREKQLSARRLFELAAAASEITRGTATHLLVNDRADIAFAARADGVHLTASSLPVTVIRNGFPKEFVIGVSTHTFDATSKAAKDGADFAVFGPIFDSPGKGDPVGIEALSEVCERSRPFPVIGLGGIDGTNFESVLATGASGIAAIRSLNDPDSLRSIAGKLRK